MTLSERLRAHADVDFDGLFREAADELDRLTARVVELERQLHQPSEIFLQCAKHLGQPWPLTVWTTGNPPPIQVCPNCKHQGALESKHE